VSYQVITRLILVRPLMTSIVETEKVSETLVLNSLLLLLFI